MNLNSSRFGKYNEMMFNPVGSLVGAGIKTFLLESSRVVFQQKGEKNYHVFYELLAGMEEEAGKGEALSTFLTTIPDKGLVQMAFVLERYIYNYYYRQVKMKKYDVSPFSTPVNIVAPNSHDGELSLMFAQSPVTWIPGPQQLMAGTRSKLQVASFQWGSATRTVNRCTLGEPVSRTQAWDPKRRLKKNRGTCGWARRCEDIIQSSTTSNRLKV